MFYLLLISTRIYLFHDQTALHSGPNSTNDNIVPLTMATIRMPGTEATMPRNHSMGKIFPRRRVKCI